MNNYVYLCVIIINLDCDDSTTASTQLKKARVTKNKSTDNG